MQVLISLLTILLSIFGYIIFLSVKANNYWKKKGIPHRKPYLLFGNLLDVVLGKKPQEQIMHEVCQSFPDEPIVGFVSFMKPILIIKDPIYAEKILIRDFSSFINRNPESGEDICPLQTNLFNMTGNKWRAIRSKLTPIFTSGKLKSMFNNMTDIGADLIKAIEKSNLECVDMQDIMGRFAMDTIGLYGFGISPKSLENPESDFVRKGEKVLAFGRIQFIKYMIHSYYPQIVKKFKVHYIDKGVRNFFTGLIKKTVDERVKLNLKRNDFIDLMLQLKNKGTIEIQSKDASDDYLRMDIDHKITEKFEITYDLLIGQAFIFLITGFDGFATSLSYTFYELSKNQKIQDKLREKILMTIEKHGKLNYDTVRDMPYLDKCLKESLRMRSPFQTLVRVCSKDYELSESLEIKIGETIVISSSYLHMDPKNYFNPEIYNPDRFHPDVTHRPCTFLPFGEGPRMCIAMRFAMLQLKYGLIKTLMTYKLELNRKIKEPIEFRSNTKMAKPKNPIYFSLTKIDY